MKSISAQLVFIESDHGHRWIGRLLTTRNVIDRESGKSVERQPLLIIEENEATGRCTVTMQGGHRGGRRYASHANVTLAQEAGIRWAGRRFRVMITEAS